MAALEIDMRLRDSGARYLEALTRLGFYPDCLFWARDEMADAFVLVLVTAQFDRVGPLELSKALFRAFQTRATPEEISPFMVRLHSPEQAAVRKMGAAVALAAPVLFIGDMKVDRASIYRFSLPAKSVERSVLTRRWRCFERNLDRIAA